jgi:hypothetical protein
MKTPLLETFVLQTVCHVDIWLFQKYDFETWVIRKASLRVR